MLLYTCENILMRYIINNLRFFTTQKKIERKMHDTNRDCFYLCRAKKTRRRTGRGNFH